jgi:hypothetical protein
MPNRLCVSFKCKLPILKFCHLFIPLPCAECDVSFAVLSSFFHSSVFYTFSCRSPPTTLLSSLSSSCHLLLDLIDFKLIYNTLLGILFPSILRLCPNRSTVCNLIVYVMVGCPSQTFKIFGVLLYKICLYFFFSYLYLPLKKIHVCLYGFSKMWRI